MKVQFIVDYRGVLTAEQYYVAGEEVEFKDDDQAQALIDEGRAVEVPEEKAAPKPKPVLTKEGKGKKS